MSKATLDPPRTSELDVQGMDCAELSQHGQHTQCPLPVSGWCTQRATVVFWPGPPLQAIYVEMGEPLALHCHYATQISISLGAPLRMRMHASGPYSEQQSFIVGPNIPHQVEGAGVPVFEILSEARALADLARRLRTTSASDLPALPPGLLSDLLPVLLASGGEVPDEQAGQALLSHVLTQLLDPSLPDEGPDDPRIATARCQT